MSPHEARLLWTLAYRPDVDLVALAPGATLAGLAGCWPLWQWAGWIDLEQSSADAPLTLAGYEAARSVDPRVLHHLGFCVPGCAVCAEGLRQEASRR